MVKITDLFKKDCNYYVHKSSDYEDMTPDDKAKSYFENGILFSSDHPQLNRTAIKISTENPKTMSKYYVDPKDDEIAQYESLYKMIGGLGSRAYAVIIEVPKGKGNELIKTDLSTRKYKIPSSNIIGVVYRSENSYDGHFEYQFFASPMLVQKENNNYFKKAEDLISSSQKPYEPFLYNVVTNLNSMEESSSFHEPESLEPITKKEEEPFWRPVGYSSSKEDTFFSPASDIPEVNEKINTFAYDSERTESPEDYLARISSNTVLEEYSSEMIKVVPLYEVKEMEESGLFNIISASLINSNDNTCILVVQELPIKKSRTL